MNEELSYCGQCRPDQTEVGLAGGQRRIVAVRCASCGAAFTRWMPAPAPAASRPSGAREQAALEARAWLDSPDAIILDTETTDLDGYLVQIAILALDGSILFDSLVRPDAPIRAAHIHGLTEEQLQDAPPFRALEVKLAEILRGRRVIVFNAPFDRSILHNELCRFYDPEHPWAPGAGAATAAEAWLARSSWSCAMRLYSKWVGEWNRRFRDYKYQRLPGGDHTALGDCRATLAILQKMAADLAAPPRAIRWFTDSPDAGAPDCLCSWCAGRIWTWQAPPIRMTSPDHQQEARFHTGCYQEFMAAQQE